VNPRTAFIAAPLLTFAYGVFRIIDGFDGSRGPGPAWTIGHLAFLGALAAFVYVFVQPLKMISRGLSNTEIAKAMVVSEHTVKTHVSNVLGKLGLRDRIQAVIVAHETGLAVPGGHLPS
jgi:hypothetical protein